MISNLTTKNFWHVIVEQAIISGRYNNDDNDDDDDDDDDGEGDDDDDDVRSTQS